MAHSSIHLKSSLLDSDAHLINFVNSFRCEQLLSSAWHHQNVSCDWEIRQYFLRTKCTRDHRVPLLNSCRSFRQQHSRLYLDQRLHHMLSQLIRSFLMASDAIKVQGHLIPSFTDVLVKRRLLETSSTTDPTDCNTNYYLPFSPHIAANTTTNYHKWHEIHSHTCLSYYL